HTWVGIAVDTVTGERTHIGAYSLPEGAGGISRNHGSFGVEWNPWNAGEPEDHCAKLPLSSETHEQLTPGRLARKFSV
ncbi:hypothetical protein B0H11DRAFT_1718502, partial [Mycena galericulata]